MVLHTCNSSTLGRLRWEDQVSQEVETSLGNVVRHVSRK
jgi:hypothetical protein